MPTESKVPAKVRLDQLVARVSDKKVFEASFPHGYGEFECAMEMLSGRYKYYLRAVRFERAAWWKFWTFGEWVRTGEVWQPRSNEQFIMLSPDMVMWIEIGNQFPDL